MTSIRILALALAGAFASPALTHAAPSSGLGGGRLVASANQQVLYYSVAYEKGSSVAISDARVGPVTSSSNGFGIHKGSTTVSDTAVLSTYLPKVGVPAGSTRSIILSASATWMNAVKDDFTGRMGEYLNKHGLSGGYFSFSQAVTTDAGKDMVISWTGSVDNAGRAVYGVPKLIEKEPGIIEAIYVPLAVSAKLPATWVYEGAGTLKWRLLDHKMYPITNWKFEDTGGAFDSISELADDQEVEEEAKLKCLIDLTHTGCTGPIDVRTLMNANDAKYAIVDYVSVLEPVYKEDIDASEDTGEFDETAGAEQTPISVIEYSDRHLTCDTLVNTGAFGYLLKSTVTRYWAEEAGTGGPLDYAPVGEFGQLSVSPVEDFTKEFPREQMGALNADRYVISPFPDKTELWDRYDPELAPKLVNTAPLTAISSSPPELTLVQMGGTPGLGQPTLTLIEQDVTGKESLYRLNVPSEVSTSNGYVWSDGSGTCYPEYGALGAVYIPDGCEPSISVRAYANSAYVDFGPDPAKINAVTLESLYPGSAMYGGLAVNGNRIAAYAQNGYWNNWPNIYFTSGPFGGSYANTTPLTGDGAELFNGSSRTQFPYQYGTPYGSGPGICVNPQNSSVCYYANACTMSEVRYASWVDLPRSYCGGITPSIYGIGGNFQTAYRPLLNLKPSLVAGVNRFSFMGAIGSATIRVRGCEAPEGIPERQAVVGNPDKNAISNGLGSLLGN